jgi:uncharacterized protein with von Willebrand factor type A (vWA) domain
MDNRIIEFIAALRTAEVRISLAESLDAMAATRSIGLGNRANFKSALKSTLVKDRTGTPIFEELFPLYFGTGAPPVTSPRPELSQWGEALLEAHLGALEEAMRELMMRALQGELFSDDELAQAARRADWLRSEGMRRPSHRSRDLRRQLGLERLRRMLQRMLEFLAAMGMTESDLHRLAEGARKNLQALSDQVDQFAGIDWARERQANRVLPPSLSALWERPFDSLSKAETATLRREVSRLAAKLRTRAALRQKRGRGPRLDAKATLRASLKSAGVPFELITKRRRRKARFTLLCDVSTSMRPVVSFLLLLMYQIQAQVGRTRSFAYIDRVEEISRDFEGTRPEVAVPKVLRRITPGHYNTDFGSSMDQFFRVHRSAVDARTTVVICGDGRNNYNDPRLDLVLEMRRRGGRLIWFNPEPLDRWDYGDSDMDAYAPHADAIFHVSNLKQLSEAVDDILL